MKKILYKIIVLSILMIFAICINSFAQSSLRFYCKEELKVNPGETIEVPIYLDSIYIEGIEKKLISFTGKIDFDEEVFELIPYTEGDTTVSFKPSSELEDYGVVCLYNEETRTIKATIDYDHIRSLEHSQRPNSTTEYSAEYLDKFIQVGTIQIKAKEDAESGYYKCAITDIMADNREFEIIAISKDTRIYINPKNTGELNELTPENNKTRATIATNVQAPKAIYSIEVSKDGKKIIFTPDEENGATIVAITNNNVKLTEEDGKFIFNSEPNMVYEFFIYGAEGVCYGNEFVKTTIDNNQTIEDNKGVIVDENGTDTEIDNKNENKNEDEESNKQENNITSNVNKSPQTGDYIIIAVGVFTLIVGSLVAVKISKKQD